MGQWLDFRRGPLVGGRDGHGYDTNGHLGIKRGEVQAPGLWMLVRKERNGF